MAEARIPEADEFRSIEEFEMWVQGMERALAKYDDSKPLTAAACRAFATASLYLARRVMRLESELRQLRASPP